MAFLDGTVVTVALPTLQYTFGASVSQIQWILDSYALTLAALLLTVGTLSDNYGHKKVFLAGTALFAVGSLACALSFSTNTLIWTRAFQGIGGALMIPGSLAILYDAFPEDQRGRAIGLWAGFSGGIAAAGPVLGGWLTEALGWQSIFYINLPIAAIAIFVTFIFVPPNNERERQPLDWLGTALITASLFCLSFGAIEAPNYGPASPLILTSLGLGLFSFLLFLWHERRTKHPMLPVSLFSIREVTIANLATFCLYSALSATIFLTVLNLQQVQGLSPLRSGLGLMPPMVFITFFSWVGGRMTDARGPRLPLSMGTLIVSAGMLWLSLTGPDSSYWAAFFPGLMLFGIGMALVIAPITKSALKVGEERAGTASGVNNAVSRVATLFAYAISGTVLALIFKSTFLSHIETIEPDPTARADLLSQVNKLTAIRNGSEVNALIDLAFSRGYFWAMLGCAALVLLAFVIVFLGMKGATKSDPKRR
jgi:EmrB/QacA subfamily drug resistance transporter